MTEDLPTTAIAPSTPEAGGILTPALNTTECNDTRKSKAHASRQLAAAPICHRKPCSFIFNISDASTVYHRWATPALLQPRM
jgi:hypothetical protein